MTTKKIVAIIMGAVLLLTLIMVAIVVGRVAPILRPMINPPENTTQTDGTTDTTSQSTAISSSTTETTSGKPVTPHEHKFDAVKESVASTCEAPGYVIYICSCGQTKVETKEALGHSFGAGKLVAASCTQDGYTERKCSVCGNVVKEDIVKALGHDWEFVKTVEANCEADGYEEWHCKRENCDMRENNLPLTEHRNVKTKLGHDWGKGVVHEPTCTEKGYTEYTCSHENCPKGTKREAEVDAKGHSFGNWEVTTEPTAGKNGEESRKCSDCQTVEKQDCALAINEKWTNNSELVWRHEIRVAAKDSDGVYVTVYTYVIVDQGRFEDMKFVYDQESGLLVIFKNRQNQEITYNLEAGNHTLTIDQEGKQVVGGGSSQPIAPGETDPPEETTVPIDEE